MLPVIFSSPETSLGFGAAALHYFRSDSISTTKPSSVRGVFIYTLQNQIITQLPVELFLQGNKYWITIKPNYFLYPFQYYGTGNQIDLDEFDNYEAKYLRVEADFLRKIGKIVYLGPKFEITEYFDIQLSDSGKGILTEETLGFQTGTVAGIGLGLIYDQRNNLFCPSGGYYLEINYKGYTPLVGSDYKFSHFEFDLRKYYNFGKAELGLQFYQNSLTGSIPFYNLARLGGSNRMRGYFRGAYRDKHYTAIQAEFRYSVHKRIVLSTFSGFGSVSPQFMRDQKWLPSVGMGIRFVIDPRERIRIRADYAFGRSSSGFYLNINEAF